jgi:hypothetical protein
MNHILQECRMNSVLDSLGIQSKSARDLFEDQSKKWSTNLTILHARSEAWRILKKTCISDWTSHIPVLVENESIIRNIDPATASESQTEDWSQILFSGEFSSFNFIPFLLMYVAMSKIFIAPLLAWTMPFMTLIIPFLALKFVYNLPISWNMYWAQMRPMIFGRVGQEMNLTTLLQYGSMFVSYAHSMYLPYTNAKHCYKIDALMIKGSNTIIDTIKRLRKISDIWVSQGLRKPWTLPEPSELGDNRQTLAWLVQDKHLLPQIYRAIGQVEIIGAICKSKDLVPVIWSESQTPMCKMIQAIDSLIPLEKRVPFTLIMSKDSHHVICTGPNRGGKSTFLRSVLTNLALAHTWGVAFASECILTPVEWVISSLRLEDRPGQESLFEREVSVAGEIVKRIRKKNTRGWVIIDELFHTTNPPDAAVASQIFLQQLWKSDYTTSIVSTHLFSHAETAPPNVQRLCVDSVLDKNQKIKYNYTVRSGMNTMSSVRELLVESNVLE